MNIQPVFTRYDINRKIPFDWSSPIVVDHVEDYETRFIEVYVYESVYNKQVDLKGTTVIARIVAALSTEKILLNDNVACTLNGSGNIIIPIDGKVIETLASTLLIEVRITQDDQALVLPFPLYVQMRGSILDDAGVAPESRGTIPELLEAAIAALEEAKNYENLENKPQINGRTLSGDKTSDDLGLQKKLTAGQNITLESDGTISAEGGGVTSYNDLTDKPYVTINNNSGTSPPWAITDGIRFAPWQFFGIHTVDGKINISLDNLVCRYHFEPISYDFNKFSSAPYNGCLELQHSFVSNFPNALNKIDTSKPYFVTQHFQTTENGVPEKHAFRKVSGYSQNGDFIEYAQICYIYYRYYTENQIISQTDWVELTSGGSQIVSGVVNANGTITFTDSDGNTFTTTGSSVIGPQGNPGQDYVLTNQDKSDIADIVLGELPTTEGVLYGNANN